MFCRMSSAPTSQVVSHRWFPSVCAWSWNKQTVFQLFILNRASVFTVLPPKGWVTNGDSTVLSGCQGKLMSEPLKVNRKRWIVSETLLHIPFFPHTMSIINHAIRLFTVSFFMVSISQMLLTCLSVLIHSFDWFCGKELHLHQEMTSLTHISLSFFKKWE